MKKFVVLISVGLLVLAFGTVYAQEKAPVLEFKASGFMDVISEYNRNVPQPGAATSATGGTSTNDVLFGPPPAAFLPGGDAFDTEQAFMEGRGRLKFDAIMGKEMSGTFQFEFDSTRWGERAGAGAQRNQSGHWGVSDRSSLELKHMYFTFGVPWIPVPTTIIAGIQPIGIRPGVFLSTDGPGITAAFKIDPATIKFVWAKALENRDWESDDVDLYALEVNAKVSTLTVGGYGVLFNANTFSPTGVADAADPDYRSTVYWFGAYADGKLGPLNLNLDFIYDTGKNEDRSTLTPGRDVDYRGWGAAANIGFPWEKFLFGFASIYGSGADLNKTSASAAPNSAVANATGAVSSKAEAYIVPGGTEGSPGHSLILCGNGINRMNTGFEPAAGNHSRATFGGMWINKLYASFRVQPEWNTRLEAMYIRDTTDNGNTIGNARSGGRFRDDNDIGWEIDWLNTLVIYKNLTFQFGGGILFAGDAMDYRVGATENNESPKNPWAITTNLTYSF